jgi:lysophospholipase L1-like esterase
MKTPNLLQRHCRPSCPLPSRSRVYPTSADCKVPNSGKPEFGWERAARFCKIKEWVRGFGSITAGNPLTPTLSPKGEREHTAARYRDLCPLPGGERAARFCKIKEWVRGFGSIMLAGNPLTPTLSPKGEREHTESAARSCAALVTALYLFAFPAFAAEPCDIPASLLSGGWDLKHVAEAVAKDKRLTIAVVGTGSSLLAGPEGPRSAYPARLEAVLRQKLPGVDVRVVSLARSRMTAEDLARGMDKMLADEKPDLVIWQTGTLDAIRRIEPEEFRAALDEGVETLHKGGADVILMNMQYSPRTDIMVPLGPYADNMRVVAQQHEIPLFDRLAVMRNWSDTGAFDLYAAGKDNVLAQRVHDCIARGIAFMIIDAAHLHPESKAAQ